MRTPYALGGREAIPLEAAVSAESVILRAIQPTDVEAFRGAFAGVFAFEPSDDTTAAFADWIEFDRTIAGFEGDRMVSTGGTLSFGLVVPGGATVSAGGLTVVSVQPTHRRRGLLHRIVEHHFDDCAGHSEVVSLLYASESSIYGRFGYGRAVDRLDLSIHLAAARLRSDLPEPRGTFEFITPADAVATLPPVYERAIVGTPGAIVRRQADWERYVSDPESWRDGATPYRHVLYRRDGEAVGAAKYRQKSSWNYQGPDGTVIVNEIIAVDAEAYAALWRFILSLDLMTKMEAHLRPIDEPLLDLLEDPRRLVRTTTDSLWLRFLDVPAALAARRYRMPVSAVIEVEDRYRPAVGGKFRLDGGPDGAECTPTTDEADIRLDTQSLASAYLGAPRLARLAWLGRVEGAPEAVASLDAAFTSPLPPYCQVPF
jgi:predicted acetyltransferase